MKIVQDPRLTYYAQVITDIFYNQHTTAPIITIKARPKKPKVSDKMLRKHSKCILCGDKYHDRLYCPRNLCYSCN